RHWEDHTDDGRARSAVLVEARDGIVGFRMLVGDSADRPLYGRNLILLVVQGSLPSVILRESARGVNVSPCLFALER
ncbi:MAG: hypothetical protein HW419_2306, partial [Deltaproteobacteria bacterium]|nr:hypothetical protein [Deltaproteobacteria bacterium]